MKNGISLDEIDLRILELLQENAQTRFSDMASELSVSSGTIHVRTKKLREMGVIVGSTIVLDVEALGFTLRALVGVVVNNGYPLGNIVSALRNIPEVISCRSTTGRYSMVLEIVCKDAVHLRTTLMERLHAVEGILKIETFLNLEEHFKKPLSLLHESEEGIISRA